MVCQWLRIECATAADIEGGRVEGGCWWIGLTSGNWGPMSSLETGRYLELQEQTVRHVDVTCNVTVLD